MWHRMNENHWSGTQIENHWSGTQITSRDRICFRIGYSHPCNWFYPYNRLVETKRERLNRLAQGLAIIWYQVVV